MYEVLRVPPNKDSYKHFYDYILEYVQPQNGVTIVSEFDEFYKNVVSAYMLSDGSVYQGICWISNTFKKYGGIPNIYEYAGYYNMCIATFLDEKNYNKVFDLVQTSIKDKTDKTIVVENVPEDNSAVKNALKNNKFKQVGTTWYRSLNEPVYTTDKDYFKGLTTKEVLDDRNSVDKMVNFHKDINSLKEAEAIDNWMRTLKDSIDNKVCMKIVKECRITEADFMHGSECCGYCAAKALCPKRKLFYE